MNYTITAAPLVYDVLSFTTETGEDGPHSSSPQVFRTTNPSYGHRWP